MKVMAMYLPQYHEIKENNEWWGEGYTEWSAVKAAKKIDKAHNQPKVPLGGNYYDLSDESGKTWAWQADLAKEYGVYGFCIYHYWFTGKQLLEKPMEILLNHPEIDIHYSICWANETWTKTWYGLETEVLMKQEYGVQEDWDNHFRYLCRFFKDPRYIKIDNAPVIHIYRGQNIDCLKEMLERWRFLAKKSGFSGLYVVIANAGGKLEDRTDLFEAYYNFEPGYTLNHRRTKIQKIKARVKRYWTQVTNHLFSKQNMINRISVDDIYKINWKRDNETKKTFLGTFPSWDNSPRRQMKGSIYYGACPEKFGKNLAQIADNSEEDDFVYINAWNEWGEGAYLEPDTENKYQYLEQIQRVVKRRQ